MIVLVIRLNYKNVLQKINIFLDILPSKCPNVKINFLIIIIVLDRKKVLFDIKKNNNKQYLYNLNDYFE